MTTAPQVRDRDGDLWVLREDGWCCQAPCSHDGELVTHSCDEHKHFTRTWLDLHFGPLVPVDNAEATS